MGGEMFIRIAARLGAVATAVFLCGCQLFGPASLEHGRVNYNESMQRTQMHEIFQNIVRVIHTEPTLFVGISEIDASTTLQTTGNPQISASKTVTSTFSGPGITVTEQPVIKYVPLQGQELVAQIARPIVASSIANLLDSNWHIVPVLQLAVYRLTPQFDDIGAALNAIGQLDRYGALVITDTGGSPAGLDLYLRPKFPSMAPVADERMPEAQNAPQPAFNMLQARKDVLHLWIRLLRIYEDTQPSRSGGTSYQCPISEEGDACLARLDKSVSTIDNEQALDDIFTKLPAVIVLRGAAAADANAPRDGAPLFLTRSALGVLKAASRVGGGIKLIDMDSQEGPALLHKLMQAANAARRTCQIWPDYYLLPFPISASSQTPDFIEDERTVNAAISSSICPRETLNEGAFDTSDPRVLRREVLVMYSRQFILIETSKTEPDHAYVSSFFGDTWYYIGSDDGISQLNFWLLSQLLTMQAVSPPNSTTPVTLPLQ